MVFHVHAQFFWVIGKKTCCTSDGVADSRVVRKKIDCTSDGLADSRVVGNEIDRVNDGLANGKEDRLCLCLCGAHDCTR